MVQHFILQRSIVEAINRPSFTASLPPLSDKTWMKILVCTPDARAENERLEFVGDALMYATIGRQLYAQLPNGTPHLYTCVRAALHSNATFSALAERLDIMAVNSSVLQALTSRTFGEGTLAPNKSRPEVKATADLFETVIGAYYMDHGFEALCMWVEEIYTPLIKAVAETFFAHQDGPNSTQRGSRMTKRPKARLIFKPGPFSAGRGSGMPTSLVAAKKAEILPVKQRLRTLEKIKSTRLSRSPPRKLAIVGTASSGAKSKVATTQDKSMKTTATSSVVTEAAPAVKRAPMYIDLTLESDTDDCGQFIRHPLVTPRIPHSFTVSKRPNPMPRSIPPPVPSPALVVDSGTCSSSSDFEDEVLLESMLVRDGSESGSDMDCGSSDVYTPARPSNLAPFLTRGLGEDTLEIPRLPYMCRKAFLR